MPVETRPEIATISPASKARIDLSCYFWRVRTPRGRLRNALLCKSPTRNKPLNALHNPVTLHVVCQLMLLRS
jgi:hypothetical protein